MSIPMALLIAAVILLDIVFIVIFALFLGKREKRPPGQPKDTKDSKKLVYVFFAIFLGMWTLFTLGMDVVIVHGAIRQTQSFHYPTVEGKVIQCKVEEKDDGDGTSYDVNVAYIYEVQGQWYNCDRLRFLRLWGKEWVFRFVEAHPAGSSIAVHYNPLDPSDAVLLTGIAGQELSIVLFMLPFNLILVGLWCLLFFRPAYFRALDEGDEVRIRLTFHPLFTGFLFLIFGPVPFSLFLFFCGGMPPTVEAAALVWVLFLSSSVLLFLVLARRAASRDRDLVIDRLRNVLILPRTTGQEEAIAVPLNTLLGVDVVREQKPDEDGPSDVYVPVLRWRCAGGDSQDAKLATWDNEDEARRLAELLRTFICPSA